MANDEIRAAQSEVVGVLDQLLVRAQSAGAVRMDVGALDVLMLVKGVCQAASNAFAHLDPEIAQRHLDLIRAALAPPSRTAQTAPRDEPRRSRTWIAR